MSTERTHEELCDEVERKLSAFLDGEMGELERFGIGKHLETCVACRRELTLLSDMSDLLRDKGADVPPPPRWASIQAAVEASERPARGARLWVGAACLAVLAGLWLAMTYRSVPDSTVREAIEPPLGSLQVAGLPGLARYLAEHQAQEVASAELGHRLAFSPTVPDRLPGGFELRKVYFVSNPSGAGSCLIYRSGREILGVVQQPPSQPIEWKSAPLVNCTIAGLSCRRTLGGEVELLQIEPDGRNVTVVARPGAIDAAPLVRALSGQR